VTTKRRAAGEGGRAYQRKDGRWQANYSISSTSGKRLRRSVYGLTQAEVVAKLKQAIAAVDNGTASSAGRETVAEYLAGWLERKAPSVRPRTADSYRLIVQHHLIPAWGRLQLRKLAPENVERLYADLRRRGYSSKSIANVHGLAHEAFQQAARWRRIPLNPVDLVDPPRVERREMQALTPEQARAVLAAVAGDPLEALYRLALSSGIRQGELLALRWGAVDLVAGTVRIVATLEQRRNHAPVIAEPKTASSRRKIDLGETTVEALRKHRTAEIEGALAAGRSYKLDGFVFSRPDGRPLSESIVRKSWLRIRTQVGAENVRFHDLRHSCASLHLTMGVHPKLVQELLGHADIAITLRTYSHVLPGMHRQAARAMDELLAGESANP